MVNLKFKLRLLLESNDSCNNLGEAWVVQWSERWTLGRTARVRVLAGALRCGLKQVASLTLLRLLG